MPNYVYHLTSSSTALLIKASGMSSTFARTGEAKAHPEGAFAKDRESKGPAKILSFVIEGLGHLLNAGVTIEQLANEARSISFSTVPVPSCMVDKHSEDSNARSDWHKRQLADFREKFFPNAQACPKPVKDRGEYCALESLKRTNYRKEKGPTFQRDYPDHFICNLAIACKDLYYSVEESLTTRGIYFTKPEYAENGYIEYAKHLGGDSIVILRVVKEKLTNPHDDPSEYKAIRSEGKVEVGDIQIFNDHKRFLNKEARDSDGNWIALGVWNPIH